MPRRSGAAAKAGRILLTSLSIILQRTIKPPAGDTDYAHSFIKSRPSSEFVSP